MVYIHGRSKIWTLYPWNVSCSHANALYKSHPEEYGSRQQIPLSSIVYQPNRPLCVMLRLLLHTVHFHAKNIQKSREGSVHGPQRSAMTLYCLQLADVDSESSGLTISNVHTRRIHTLSFPSTPSTSLNSTPSHQHLLAGFRQKSRSFCAIPTALLPVKSPLMSVLNLASARLQMTALFGSPARWPQQSS